MRKNLFILALTALTQLLLSCSKDLPEYDYSSSTKKEYNINNEGLFIDDESINENEIIFNGRIDNKLWIGCYNTSTKKQIFEWTGNDKLETDILLDLGYGEFSKVKVDRFFLRDFYYIDSRLYFILDAKPSSDDYEYRGKELFSDLYFIDNNKLIKKQRSFAYPTYDVYKKIIPWYNYSIFTMDEGNKYICFSEKGDILYKIDMKGAQDLNINYDLSKYEPVNLEEGITDYVRRSSIRGTYLSFEKDNLKSKEHLWRKATESLKSVTENDRLDSKSISKKNNIWSYSYHFTSMDGSKFTITINVNIESGEISIKE